MGSKIQSNKIEAQFNFTLTPIKILHLAEEALVTAKADGDLDACLVAAICFLESANEPWAMRFEPGYKYTIMPGLLPEGALPHSCTRTTENFAQCCSYGLMQIMGATARELGFKGWFAQLFFPDVNLVWGVKYLHKQWRRYHSSRGLPAVIAAYNAGSPRTHKSGAFENQVYVDKVIAKYEKLKQEKQL